MKKSVLIRFVILITFILIGIVGLVVSESNSSSCGNGVCETGEDVKNICPTCQSSEDCPCQMQCPQDCNATITPINSGSENSTSCLKEGETGISGKNVCCPGLKTEYMQTASIGSVPGIACTKCIGNNCNVTKKNGSINLVGNDTDSYGCIGSAGYTWCEEKQKCLRIWEENCTNKTLPGEGKVKILPEAASLIARERLGELGFNVSLKEVGQGNSTKPYYEVSAVKEGKMLGLFKVKGKVSVDIDAETGEVIKVHKPWWGFMAGI